MPLGSFVLRAVGFTDPFTQLPTKWGRQRTWRLALCLRNSSAHAYKQCVHKHRGAACTPCPLNQSVSLRSHSCTRGSFVLGWPTLRVERCQRPFLLNWLLAAAFPPYASCIYLRETIFRLSDLLTRRNKICWMQSGHVTQFLILIVYLYIWILIEAWHHNVHHFNFSIP